MEIVYVLLAVVALVVGYFLFFKRSEEPRLGEADRSKALEAGKDAPRKDKENEKARPAAERAAEKEKARPSEPPPSAEREIAAERGEDAVAVEEAPPSAADVSERPTRAPDVQSLRKGLAKSRAEEGFFGKLKALFTGRAEIDEAITEEIEEVLLTSDVGVQTTQRMLDSLRDDLKKGDLRDSSKVWEALRQRARGILAVDDSAGGLRLGKKPTVVLLVGVNGAGKTTTIGKLATQLKAEGRTCVLAAGDTFRAAAVQQLTIWSERVGCEIVRGKDGADPGSVVFDAIRKAEEIGADVVLADTAGRLHTKSNLMNEMKKIAKTAGKALEGAPHETLLVIDATNGQNALAQAREFKEALDLTGIVLTKLDGTAKGGMVLGICDSLKVPVRYVGLGERADDLHEFDPDAFVEALLGRESEADAA